jgi:hypothetical protein
MSESELAQKVTTIVKRMDKLVGDIKKDTANLLEALRQLKEKVGGSEDADK